MDYHSRRPTSASWRAPSFQGLKAAGIGLNALAILFAASLSQAQLPSTLTVKKAEDWTALFDGHKGWTGGDGIFAIPLSGYEGPDKAESTKTLFVFSDTFIGDVDPVTNARKNATMVNNSMAVLDGGKPDSTKLRFIGHSLGGSVLAKYLSQERIGIRIAALCMVATPYWGEKGWEYEPFYLKEGFGSKLSRIPRIFLYHSRDDKVVAPGHVRRYAEALPKATVRLVKGRGHAFDKEGLPERMEDLSGLP